MTTMVGGGPLIDSSIGLEEVERGALRLLIDNLNDEIVARSRLWAQADLDWQSYTDSNVGQVDVEQLLPDHFHEGPHQSILNEPVEAFPSLAVMCYFVQPAFVGPDRFDQFETGSLRLFVEAYCRAGPVVSGTEMEFESIVHRRIERTTEAINAVVMRDKTLCGTAKPGISTLPRGGIGGQSWVRREEKGSGPRHMWQGSRLEYVLQRHSIF